METSQSRLHPILWVAAVAVIIFSAMGVAAITGVLPVAGSKTSQPPAAAAATPAELVTKPASDPLPAAKAAAKPIVLSPADAVPKPLAAKAQPAAESKPAPAKPASTIRPAGEARPKPVQVAQYDPPVEERSPGRAYEPASSYDPPPAPVSRTCRDCGVIETVREIKAQGEGSGLGAVAGGVLGGVLGHQVGGGRGRDVATVLGAVGGAVAGHQVEKTVRTGSRYEVVVRFDDGTSQVFQQDQAPAWRSGDHVKVLNGVISAN